MSEETDRRIEDPVRLVSALVRRYYGWHPDKEELLGIGNLALVKAVQKYDEQGIDLPFVYYVCRTIRRDIWNHLRDQNYPKRKPAGGLLSLDQPAKEDSDILYHQLIGTDPDGVVREVERRLEAEEIQAALAQLPEKEQGIVERAFGLNGQQEIAHKEIAREMDLSRGYVSRLYQKSLQQLREILEQKSPSPVAAGEGT